MTAPLDHSSVRRGPSTIVFFDHTARMGGGELALFNLVCALDRCRITPVVVLGSDGELRQRFFDAGIETHLLSIGESLGEARKDTLGIGSLLRVKDALHALIYVGKLARFLRGRRADALHTNSLKADLLGGLAGRFARIPVIWHVRDRISEDYLPSRVVRIFRWLCRILPTVVIANSRATLETLSLSPGGFFSRLLGAVFQRGAPPQLRGVPEWAVVYSGAAPSMLQQDDGSEILNTGGRVNIGLLGRIAPWKGQHVFIEAAAEVLKQYPGCQFKIIGAPLFGEHAYADQLRARVKTLGLTEQFEFSGFRNDVAAAIQELDVVVHASTSPEPFGQVVVEAMALGRPVVATDGGGVRETVVHEVTGLLVPMKEPLGMAKAINQLLQNPKKARKMGCSGAERVRAYFTVDHAARKVEQIYDLLFASLRPRARSSLNGVGQEIENSAV